MIKSINQIQLERKEWMQRVVLAALSKSGFFDEAAFYGGTCLRLFYGLDRFSEDMDFSLLKKNPEFTLEKYFQAITDEFRMYGKNVEIKKKDKKSFGKVQSAFLKDNTDTYDIKFQTEPTPKIKIEADFMPPLEFTTEANALQGEITAAVRTFTPECLFAGKMHALLFRQWQERIKGRDWYDFAWYIDNEIPMDYDHFRIRVKEFNGLDLSPRDFITTLVDKINSTDIEAAKRDVFPFIINKSKLDSWSTDYFLDKASKLIIQSKHIALEPDNSIELAQNKGMHFKKNK